MKQMSLDNTGFEGKTKRTRKREFLDEMNLVVPWSVDLTRFHGRYELLY
jgi:IS5 family transposase